MEFRPLFYHPGQEIAIINSDCVARRRCDGFSPNQSSVIVRLRHGCSSSGRALSTELRSYRHGNGDPISVRVISFVCLVWMAALIWRW